MEFCLVEPAQREQAYQWHRGFAAANDHLFPRPGQTYQNLIVERRVWCARNHEGDYIALAYFDLDGRAWEIGGLMVSVHERGNGIAGILARLTLGHLLFSEDPLGTGQTVVAHVHADNDEPRPLIQETLKFRFARHRTWPKSAFPGLRANERGEVEGDEFELGVPDSLTALANWCDAWTGALRDGRHAQVTLAPHTSLRLWAEAFRDMARR